jgi:hypothetical protein
MMRSGPSKITARRAEAPAHARRAQVLFERMVARCKAAGEVPNQVAIDEFTLAFAGCEQRIKDATAFDELEWLEYEADQHAQLRAYVCPTSEILDEGASLIDLLLDWGVPESGVYRLRTLLNTKCNDATGNPQEARGALREIMRDVDASDTFIEDYEEQLKSMSRVLLSCVVGGISLSFVALIYSRHSPLFFPLSVLFAGAAGSCTSVLARLPASEVTTSAVSVSMERRALSRVGTGLAASLVGCALLAWGVVPIVINQVSYSDVLSACSRYSEEHCSNGYALILLAVPIMLGFSERILTSLQDKLFGSQLSRRSQASSDA